MKRIISKPVFYSLLILLCFPLLTSFVMPQQDTTDDAQGPFRVRTIVIDAGHGGKDPGAAGTYSTEKSVALAIG